MLTLIVLSTALMQEPPALPPPPALELRGQFIFTSSSAEGPGNIDADGDGQVTRDEFAAPLNLAFSEMDKDGDGRLSRAELAADGGQGAGRIAVHRPGRPPEAGRDGDPRSGPEGRPPMVFVRADGPGGDGPRVFHLGGSGPNGPGGRMVVRRPEGPGHGPDALDKDGDGKVSEAEFTAPLREAFADIDADHSGFIEAGEHGDGERVRVFTHRDGGAREE